MLLSEFGVTQITRVTDRGEMIHRCSLPWHNDRNPSASLNYKLLVYHCLGCQSSGGLLWYIGTCRGSSTADAIKWLRDQTGLGNEAQPLSALLDFFEAIYENKNSNLVPLPKISERVLEPWRMIHPYLTDPVSQGGRGIPEATIQRFQVGYGVLPINIGTYDSPRWVKSPRIVIPHFWRGDLVGWQSRRLLKDGTPKYQSSPDLPKDRTIYNYGPRAEYAVVVESPMSVLSKAHLDPPIESTMSASVTDRQIRLLSVHPKLVLFFDNDDAGWAATERLSERLESYSLVYVVQSPWAADPADMDDATYLRLVETAVPSSLWYRPEELMPWAS